MDEQLVSDYKYTFTGSQADNVLDNLKELCEVDTPLCTAPLPTDRELLTRAIKLDIYNYIAGMVNYKGE